MQENFFINALREAMTKHHFNQAQLSEFLGVDPAYISRWLKGSSPRIDQMLVILSALGYDLDRAHPAYDPCRDALKRVVEGDVSYDGSKISTDDLKAVITGAAQSQWREKFPETTISGSIDATTGKATPTKESEPLEGIVQLFPELAYCQKQLRTMRVVGEAMSPAVKDGSLVFLRKIVDEDAVPTGAIILFETARRPQAWQMRRLIRMPDDRPARSEHAVGAALGPHQDDLVFTVRECRMDYIVVGVLEFPKQ